MNKSLLISFFSLFLLLSCVSTNQPKKPEAKSTTVNQRTPLNCAATMAVPEKTEIKIIDDGILIIKPSQIYSGFKDNVAFSIEKKYFFNGETRISNFELIYSGVSMDEKSNSSKIDFKNQEVFGLSTSSIVYVTARSSAIDPYLVACSNNLPVFDNGYWYFMPGMYIPTEMKWLSFEPTNYDSFKKMYDHALEPENEHSYTSFNWWSLLKTTLPSYPILIENSSPESYEQIIDYKGIPLHLIYQKGFLEFLQKEYILGDPIFLYLQISGIDGFKKEYNCYVRDFSLIPPEEIINERMDSIKVNTN